MEVERGQSCPAACTGTEGEARHLRARRSCRGTVQEGVGGRILCLGPAGQDLVTLRRHHVGRCFLIGGYAYQIMASAPEDRWPAIEPTLRAVVDSFRVI